MYFIGRCVSEETKEKCIFYLWMKYVEKQRDFLKNKMITQSKVAFKSKVS